ncbi:manganese-dependent inorganic pyrophosphatase [Roseicyclus sp. F158]|uniref:inorganic diphosphatase n=1 Tax=Tropicimonas omnivorans TaxID=3075590 RepID=A0ABU3DFX5_9RHOB|nr:manganese-dependent inorganic pyrophosphatase [Roseicyclus sp. F158]MDT0682592.1 manganese-dependent inorganic pyrophosphatase [Roseicyclus sp. F158]
MTLQVFGHKAPDTDATCSAIIWAWYLSEHRGTPAVARILGEPNTEAAFVLQRWSLDRPEIIDDVAPGDAVVIVDTNNPAELPAGIGAADIREIIDHHRLTGGLETTVPINITVRPVACTATILHDLMGADASTMPEGIKAAMLSCILSDTLEFRSPTTTDVDRALAEQLAGELDIVIADYAEELFAAKSDVSRFSEAELLRMDSKECEVDGTKYRVSVLETTSAQSILARKEALKDATAAVAAEDGVDEVLLFVVDILREEATMLIQNERVKGVAERSFDKAVSGDTVVLPGVMSRKKQIIPALKG